MNENDSPTEPGPAAAGGAPWREPAAGDPHHGPAAHPGPAAAPAAGSRAGLVRDVVTSRGAGWAVAAILAGTVAGLSIVLANGQAGPVTITAAGRPAQFFAPPGGQVSIGPGGPVAQRVFPGPGAIKRVVAGGMVPGGQQIIVGPAAMGGQGQTPFGQVVAGTVGSVSGSTFTVQSNGSPSVTVHEQSSTVYRQTGNPASASAVTKGARVAVLGTLSGSTMTAAAVAVLAG